MTLLLEIEKNHSADAVMIGNVVSYMDIGEHTYCVTYRDPNKNNELYDIMVKHVKKIEEVK